MKMFQRQELLQASLMLLSFVSESNQQNYPDFASADCYPSFQCTLVGDCPETTENVLLDLEQTGCNQSSISEGSSQYCQCDTTTCYKFREHCLTVCENQGSDHFQGCVSCLSTLEHSLTTLDSQSNHNCKEHCKGTCLDLYCGATTPGDCIGCAPGYWGSSCLDQCAPDCSGGECHADSGFCVNCLAGSYGPECEFKCPENCLQGRCFSRNGTCEVCAPGYKGQNCNDTCLDGFYGDRCAFKCSANCKGNRCDHVRGQCLDGCKPGYFGLDCKQYCPAGTYGQDCLSNCPASCAEGKPCNHQTGECQSGCLSGFKGAYCNKTCPVDKYGANCYFNCSTSCFHRLCNAFSGTCLACDETFYGPLCQYKIDLDEIRPNTLEAEVSTLQAVLMISGIALLGVMMWIGVAYILLQQRKKILRDAANGIHPQYSQWGMFPNAKTFKRAVNVYNKSWIHLGGGDAEAFHKREENEEIKEEKRERMFHRAQRKLRSWINPKKKLKPPDEVDIEQVSRWLATNQGIRPHSREDFERYVTTGIHSDTGTSDSSEDSEDDGSEYDDETKSSETSETGGTGLSNKTHGIQDLKEETEMPYSRSKGQEETITNEEPTLPMNTEQSLTQGISQISAGQCSSHEPLFIGNTPIRRDTIYLSAEPQHGGPNTQKGPKYLKETTRVRWLSNDQYGSKRITRAGSTSSKEPISSTGSFTASSKPEASSSSSSSSSSGSSTMTNTNTSWRTRSGTSDSSSSSDTSSSDEDSYTSEGSSLSTKVATREEQKKSAMDGEISLSLGTRPISTSEAEVKTKNAGSNMIGDEPDPPGFFQKLADFFRKKMKSQEEEEQSCPQTTTQSITGAGGMPRPYCDKFVINRSETWHRNRGLEVTVDDGMMEVAGSQNRRPQQRQDQGEERDGPSVSTKTKRSEMSEESSFDPSNPYTWSTSGEELTDVPSTMVTDTINKRYM